MLSARNTVNITGGLTADPEMPTDKVMKFRLAVDYAGNEKDSDNNSGYFNVTMFVDDKNRSSSFVKKQIDEGKMKKGSQVAILGRLVHERWKSQDGKNASQVVIIAEAIDYVGRGEATNSDGGQRQQSAGSSNRSEPTVF